MTSTLLRWLARRRVRAAVAAVPAEAVPADAAARDPSPVAPLHSGLPDDLAALLAARVATLEARLADPEAGDAAAVLGAQALARGDRVRQLPAAAQEALAATREADPSPFALAAICRRDPTLIAALLRTANSSWYGSGERIEAIPAAIKRVGLAGLRNVLLAHALEGMLCRPGARYDGLVTAVWSHLVRTAPLARALAPSLGVAPEPAFTLGLLHDVGKLVLLDGLAAFRREHRRAANVPAPLLAEALRALHEPLGGIAVLRWGLPAEAAQVIARHHDGPTSPDPATRVVALAERLDIAWVRGTPLDLAVTWREWGLPGEAPAVAPG